MKLILIEGGDRLGKSTIIEGLCKHFNYDNVTIRHFGKPPKGLTSDEVTKIQFHAFHRELNLFSIVYSRSMEFSYYPEVMIWNRSHLGEFVYSQMFRGGKSDVLKKMLLDYERAFISHEVYLITLTADPEFFFSKEDGNSFSNKLEDKTKELELFKEAHDFSIIANKLYLKVDKDSGCSAYEISIGSKPSSVFRTKKSILNEVIQFIK
jgi:thymidylate kinase